MSAQPLPVTYKTDVKCDVCKKIMRDVAVFDAGFFIQGSICDSCTGKILRGFNPELKGETQQ